VHTQHDYVFVHIQTTSTPYKPQTKLDTRR